MMADVRLVKRYAGVRLYDTAALAYVTVEQVREIHQAKGATVVVQHADTGEDLTHILLQVGRPV